MRKGKRERAEAKARLARCAASPHVEGFRTQAHFIAEQQMYGYENVQQGLKRLDNYERFWYDLADH